MQKFIVTPNEAGQRLGKLLFKYLNLAPKSFIYKMLRKKNITLNHKKCDGSEKIFVGDEVISATVPRSWKFKSMPIFSTVPV